MKLMIQKHLEQSHRTSQGSIILREAVWVNVFIFLSADKADKLKMTDCLQFG